MKEINSQMRILTGIAIILVVLGHLDCQILSFWGLFPYYSFHVMIFMFVSGYFYRSENEDHILAYIRRKALHLLVPYYIWNVIYGLISTVLAHKGFSFCSSMTLYNFLIEPFLGGHQYGLNFAAWFVPALFIIEVLNVVGRRLFSLMKIKKDWLICLLTLAAGIGTVWLAKGGHVWGLYKTPGRILFMLPVYEFGILYRSKLEPVWNRLHAAARFLIILALQGICYLYTGGSMNFSAVWCTGFASLPFIPYVTTLTGTFLWMEISGLIGRCRLGKVVSEVGEHSFDVMMHHVTVFFCINLITLCALNASGQSSVFDMDSFLTNVNYTWLPDGNGMWRLVYAVCGVSLPVLISGLVIRIKGKIRPDGK